MQANKKYKKGFGIIEVLIASVIIGIVLVSASLLGKSVLASSGQLQNRAQAIYLAQEGIELMRQIRDTNWVNGSNQDWDYFDLSQSTSMTEQLEEASPIFGILGFDGAKKRVRLVTQADGNTPEYITLGNQTFQRQIKFEKVSTDDNGQNGIIPRLKSDADKTSPDVDATEGLVRKKNSVKVTCTVSWETYHIDISEVLTNWRPKF